VLVKDSILREDTRDVTMDSDSNQTSDSSASHGRETATSDIAEQEAPVVQTTAGGVQVHTNSNRTAETGGRSRRDIGTLRSPEAAAAGAGDSSQSMEKNESSAPKVSEELTDRTQGFHHKGRFRWIITNYSHLPQEPKRRRFSRKFSLCGHMWQLSVAPGGEDRDATTPFLSVFLWYKGEEELETKATVQLVVHDEHARRMTQRHMSRIMGPYTDNRNGISKARGWTQFAPANYITRFAKDDRIVLELQLEVKGVTLNTVTETACFRELGRSDAHARSQLLRKGFESLLQTGTLVDVTFDVSGTEFKAHKAIIAILCPVLAAMFSHNSVTNSAKRVPIGDVQPVIFAEVLKYIYSSQCSLQHPELLLAAADRFCLVELCELCALRLLGTLSIENVCDRLILAYDHSIARLESGCLTFISANANAVLNSEGFRSLRRARPLLPVPILETICREKEAAEKCNGTHDGEDVSDAGGIGSPQIKRSRLEV